MRLFTVSDVGLQMLISAVNNMNLQIESSTSVTVFCCFERLNPIKSLNGQFLLLSTWDEPVYIFKQIIQYNYISLTPHSIQSDYQNVA